MTIEVKPLVAGEGAILFEMVKVLAHSHGMTDHVRSTPAAFERDFFEQRVAGGALIARCDGVPAGCAVWHASYSTFRGGKVMYLEDLAVLPAFRRRGVARALLKAVAALAVENGYPSAYWVMMNWNNEARKLYQSFGAEIEDGYCWCVLRDGALKAAAQ